MAYGPSGSQSLVVSLAFIWHLLLSNLFTMTQIIGQKTSSVSLMMIKKKTGKNSITWVCCHLKELQQVGEIGWLEPHTVQQRDAQSPGGRIASTWEQITPQNTTGWGTDWLESKLAERDLDVLVDTKQNMIWWYPFATKTITIIWVSSALWGRWTLLSAEPLRDTS